MHFFEAIERENDYNAEYAKLESLCACNFSHICYSINGYIEENFIRWKRRSNYTSYNELRWQLGFCTEKDYDEIYYTAIDITLEKYILFCEMIINLIIDLEVSKEPKLKEEVSVLIDTIKATVAKAGMKIRSVDDEIMIVVNSPIAVGVADKNLKIANPIIEYNQYLLKGNLERKRELLKRIADDLEPKRERLIRICGRQTKDFFHLVNTMDVRHNNIDPADNAKYNSKFAKLNAAQKEEWYDLIYEQALALYVAMEQQKRNEKIDKYKQDEAMEETMGRL